MKLAIVLLAGAPVLLMAESAQRMVSICKPITEAKVGAENRLFFEETFESGICWGAFGALQEVSRVGGTTSPVRPVLPLGCIPEGRTRSQMVAVFVEFVRRNPQRMHEEFIFVAMDAMKAAFPCRDEQAKNLR